MRPTHESTKCLTENDRATSESFSKSKDNMKSKFLVAANYPLTIIHIAAVSTYLVVLTSIYMGMSVYCPDCTVCLCVFV